VSGSERDFETEVRRVIEALGSGEVMTYGEVASEAGFPGAARAVGGILRPSNGLPWWRIVTATGRLVPGNEAEHKKRLVEEGVTLRNGRVAM